MIELSKIIEKNKLVDDVTARLKSEFVGIDDQIDQVMSNLRTWFLYPDMQISPIVIIRWGLSGIGKTSLVRKIVKYLGVESDLVYFNFAEINDMNAYEIEEEIDRSLGNGKKNRVFVYDEFQYAATLDENGCEKDKRSGLKPFWELLDTGLLHRRSDFYGLSNLYRAVKALTMIEESCHIELENGVWANSDKCLAHFDEYDVKAFRQVLNFNAVGGNPKGKKPMNLNTFGDYYVKDDDDSGKFILSEGVASIVKRELMNADSFIDVANVERELRGKDSCGLIATLQDVLRNASKGYDLNFNESVIFVIGNLDEAYTMAFDVNPDMSPDQFRKLSEKISIVDIKEALRKRFRNEQIARLGNCHVIYPAFSKKNFEDIIKLKLAEYSGIIKEKTEYGTEFDQSVLKLIYKESVYPTHGTRPVFSSIHELINTRFPSVMMAIVDKDAVDTVKKIRYSYRGRNIVVDCLDADGNVVVTHKFEPTLRLDKLRKPTKDEEQAMCALHESGHFIVYVHEFGKLPEKLVSRSAESSVGGFLMKDSESEICSKRTYISNIMVCLGGYAAERKYFGEDYLSSGASSDLHTATKIASAMVRYYGMYDHLGSYSKSVQDSNMMLESDGQRKCINEAIEGVIKKCYEAVLKIFDETGWEEMLGKSARYLSTHASMPTKKMTELYAELPDSMKKSDISSYYRDIVNQL